MHFSGRVCFSIKKGSGMALFKMQLRKALQKNCYSGGCFNCLNNQQNRS